MVFGQPPSLLLPSPPGPFPPGPPPSLSFFSAVFGVFWQGWRVFFLGGNGFKPLDAGGGVGGTAGPFRGPTRPTPQQRPSKVTPPTPKNTPPLPKTSPAPKTGKQGNLVFLIFGISEFPGFPDLFFELFHQIPGIPEMLKILKIGVFWGCFWGCLKSSKCF